MKSLLFSVIFIVFSSIPMIGQFQDDFPGPEVNTQIDWQGDISAFRINEGRLQLFDQLDQGEAILFAEAATSLDKATTWTVKVQLDFSPSPSNFSRIYLGANTNNLSSANAYYLQVGGISGGDDALVLYRQDGENNRQEILSGQIGAVGSSPATASIKISRTPDGVWTLEADYTGGTDYQMEDAAIDATYDQLNYFGFYCKYTSTRSELFFFDEVFVDPLFEDNTPPSLDTIYPLSKSSIQIEFSEPVGPKAFEIAQYSISPEAGAPVLATAVQGQNNAVLLVLSQPMQNLQDYTMTIKEVDDRSGNIATNLQASFRVLIPDAPAENGLLLTEVLFNAQSGGKDFIEIYNTSDKVISLKGLRIKNALKATGNTEEIIEEDLIILPKSYLAITPDLVDLKARYPIPDTAILFEADLPTLEANDGNVSLIFNNQTFQSFDYEEGLHSSLLKNDRGVSLERISFLLSENDPQNWISAAAATGFATPGYANSQNTNGRVSTGNIFELDNKTFSPDGDSFEDLLILNYQTERAGFLANIRVFDASGRLITILNRNEALATRGLVTWDGSDTEGVKARTGVYVIWIEIFTPEGDKQVEKLSCVLASKM